MKEQLISHYSQQDHDAPKETVKDFHQDIQLSDKFWINFNYKYFNAFILILSALCNSMVVQSLSTINHELTQYYSITSSLVSFCALQFMLINPFSSLIANYILDNKGLKMGISINCVLVMIGVSMRMFIHESFYFVIIGNAFNAMGNIFLVNCPARFSSIWFQPAQRVIVTSLIVFANAVSGQIGAIISPLFVSDNLTPEEGRAQVQYLINFQAILITSMMMANLLLFRGLPSKSKKSFTQKLQSMLSEQLHQQKQTHQNHQPHSQNQTISPYIPSLLVHKKQKKKKQSYLQIIKKLFTNRNYILILLSLTCFCAILNCFATNIQLYIIPFGYSSSDAGYITLLTVVTGLTGSIISGLIIKKVQKFKIIILIQIILSVITIAAIVVSLTNQWTVMVYVSCGFFAMFLYPLFPAAIQYACQCMHPIRQSTITGFMIAVGQLGSFAIASFQAIILQQKTKQSVIKCFFINGACYISAFILFLFSKQKLKRLNQSHIVDDLNQIKNEDKISSNSSSILRKSSINQEA